MGTGRAGTDSHVPSDTYIWKYPSRDDSPTDYGAGVSDSSLQLPLERLITGLRAHATAMVSDGEPSEVMRAINEVRTAALDYVKAVFETSGWGNVFADLEDDEEEDDWEDDDDTFVVEEGVERLSLTGRWDFLVRDAAALQTFAAERLRTDVPDADLEDVAEHSADAGAALESLIAKDVGAYPGLERAGGGWTVEPIEKTLFEMDSNEREVTGF
jgi:hypothetical protein